MPVCSEPLIKDPDEVYSTRFLSGQSRSRFIHEEFKSVKAKLDALTQVMRDEYPETEFDATKLFYYATFIAGRVISDRPRIIPFDDSLSDDSIDGLIFMNHYWQDQIIPGGLQFRHGFIKYPEAIEGCHDDLLDLYEPVVGIDSTAFRFLRRRDGSESDQLKENVLSAVRIFFRLSSHDWFHNIAYLPEPGTYDFFKPGCLQEEHEEDTFQPLRKDTNIESFRKYSIKATKYEILSHAINYMMQDKIYDQRNKLEQRIYDRFNSALNSLVELTRLNTNGPNDENLPIFQYMFWVVSSQAALVIDPTDVASLMLRVLSNSSLSESKRELIASSINGIFQPAPRNSLSSNFHHRNEALQFTGMFYYVVRDFVEDHR